MPNQEAVLPDQGKIIQPMESTKALPKSIILGVYALLVLLGIGTGYLLAQKNSSVGLGSKAKIMQTGKVVGSTDTKTFRDSAEGVIEKGGVDGEGTHRLIRDPKRPDQTAFLVSSVVDLDEYIGKKVKVWGETFAAKKAAWLMDVGKIEIQ